MDGDTSFINVKLILDYVWDLIESNKLYSSNNSKLIVVLYSSILRIHRVSLLCLPVSTHYTCSCESILIVQNC